MIGRKKAIEMLKIADAALQNNGAPCIYMYCNDISVSRGDYMGIDEPVRKHTAYILFDTEELRDLLNPYMYSFKDAVDMVMEMCNDGDI